MHMHMHMHRPFDVQYCPVIIGVYRYEATQVNLSWMSDGVDTSPADATATHGLHVGEWTAEVVEVKEFNKEYYEDTPTTYRYAVACFKLTRHSIQNEMRIVISVLLVLATYSGLFVSAAAAPGRIALAFLCFLMVLNNLNSTFGSLPSLPANGIWSLGLGKVWLIDFLFFTMLANFLLLLEYAVVNFTMTKKKPTPAATSPGSTTSPRVNRPDAEQTEAGSGITLTEVSTFSKRSVVVMDKMHDVAAKRINDRTCRLCFLPVYTFFFVILFLSLPTYSTNDTCVYG